MSGQGSGRAAATFLQGIGSLWAQLPAVLQDENSSFYRGQPLETTRMTHDRNQPEQRVVNARLAPWSAA